MGLENGLRGLRGRADPVPPQVRPRHERTRSVAGRVPAAAWLRFSWGLARLAAGGRLVAITGGSLSPDNPSWRDGFVRLQERGGVVFSAGFDGRVYARHGTTTETRLTIIDRIPADDPTAFPASPGTAGDTATLLDWVTRYVPPRPPVTGASAIASAIGPTTRKTLRPQPLPNTRSQRSSAANNIEPPGVELPYE